MTHSLDYLQQAASISGEMLVAARAQQWDLLNELDVQRVKAIESSFAYVSDLPIDKQLYFLQQVERLDVENTELISLLESDLGEVRKAILQKHISTRAIKLYQQNT
ncbi:MAG: hypothetical protein OIF55_18140 [Amphritea sp.]|nr:hypothetical protein [Amphritea sp.]